MYVINPAGGCFPWSKRIVYYGKTLKQKTGYCSPLVIPKSQIQNIKSPSRRFTVSAHLRTSPFLNITPLRITLIRKFLPISHLQISLFQVVNGDYYFLSYSPPSLSSAPFVRGALNLTRIHQVKLIFKTFRNPFQQHLFFWILRFMTFFHKFKCIVSCHL